MALHYGLTELHDTDMTEILLLEVPGIVLS